MKDGFVNVPSFDKDYFIPGCLFRMEEWRVSMSQNNGETVYTPTEKKRADLVMVKAIEKNGSAIELYVLDQSNGEIRTHQVDASVAYHGYYSFIPLYAAER